MSLKVAHIIFVTTAISCSLAGARWASEIYESTRRTDMKVVMDASVAMAALLLVYGIWFYRKLQKNPVL